MVAHLIAGLAVAMAAPQPSFEPYIASERVLPEVHRQIERAEESYESGEWNRTIACSNVVLFIDAIRYRVVYDGESPKRLERQREALDRAMRMWEEALGNQVRFEESSDAIVTINFQESVQNRGVDVGGHIRWRRDIAISPSGDFEPNVRAEIWVRTIQPNGKEMSVDAMKHVAGHELGHVLGMNDSPTVGDIMGPINLRKPTKALQSAEIEALMATRERAVLLRKSSLVSALRELEGYNLSRASR